MTYTRSYSVVGSLDELHGPTSGDIMLPRSVHWAPSRRYNLDADADAAIVYERVLREGDAETIASMLHGPTLRRLWPRLVLPSALRHKWEARFPELSRRAAA